MRNFLTHLKKLKKVHQKTPEDSFFGPIKVRKDKLDSMKLKISRNKNVSTTIDKERYTLSDVNDLVNKKTAKVSERMRLLIGSNDIVKKGEKIAELRQTKNRQKSLGIVNSLKEIFNEQPNTTDMPDLESEESAVQRRNQPGRGINFFTPD